MHIEGIGQVASALNELGIYNDDIWLALDQQVKKRDSDSFHLEFVKMDNYDPTAFDYIGQKGGLMARAHEHQE